MTEEMFLYSKLTTSEMVCMGVNLFEHNGKSNIYPGCALIQEDFKYVAVSVACEIQMFLPFLVVGWVLLAEMNIE